MVFLYNITPTFSMLTSKLIDNKKKHTQENIISTKHPLKELTPENKLFLKSLGFKLTK